MKDLREFSQERIAEVASIVEAMFKALPKAKQLTWLGALNEILIALEAAQKAAPPRTESFKPPDENQLSFPV